MSYLTREAFLNSGTSIRSFTCCTCNGFKHQQPPYFLPSSDAAVCTECYENNINNFPPRASTKPGLTEVLRSIHQAEYSGYPFTDWVLANNDGRWGEEAEERLRDQLIKYMEDVWREHYLKITGEEWK